MKHINKVINGMDKIMVIISSTTLLIMVLWIFLDVVLRTFFNSPIKGTLEITGEYLMVILVYFALSYTQKHDSHIRVELFYEKFPKFLKKTVTILTNLLAAFFFIYISVLNFNVGLEYSERGMRSIGTLSYPLAPALFIISFGLVVISLRLLLESFQVLTDKSSLPDSIKDSENVS